jgi:hypothetical protein
MPGTGMELSTVAEVSSGAGEGVTTGEQAASADASNARNRNILFIFLLVVQEN